MLKPTKKKVEELYKKGYQEWLKRLGKNKQLEDLKKHDRYVSTRMLHILHYFIYIAVVLI